MADTITFRPDEDASRALQILTRDSTPVSTAVRTALIEAARRQASQRLRAEAAALASDEDDNAGSPGLARYGDTACVVMSTGSAPRAAPAGTSNAARAMQ